MRRALSFALAATLGMAVLWYLHDPPWLAGIESGFRGWETAPDGTRWRWTTGHASFFVPATAAAIVIPIRASFEAADDPRVMVSVSIDDRPADEFALENDAWRMQRLRLPPPGKRRLRRIDIRVDRLRPGHRGVQIGEIALQ
jgi:hypothetical protein